MRDVHGAAESLIRTLLVSIQGESSAEAESYGRVSARLTRAGRLYGGRGRGRRGGILQLDSSTRTVSPDLASYPLTELPPPTYWPPLLCCISDACISLLPGCISLCGDENKMSVNAPVGGIGKSTRSIHDEVKSQGTETLMSKTCERGSHID